MQKKAHTHTHTQHVRSHNTSHDKVVAQFFSFPVKVRRWRFSGTAVITESKHGAPSGSMGVIFGRAATSQWARRTRAGGRRGGARIGSTCLNRVMRLPGLRSFRDIKQGERLGAAGLHKMAAACIELQRRGWSASGFNFSGGGVKAQHCCKHWLIFNHLTKIRNSGLIRIVVEVIFMLQKQREKNGKSGSTPFKDILTNYNRHYNEEYDMLRCSSIEQMGGFEVKALETVTTNRQVW